jgi:uncharacterized protein
MAVVGVAKVMAKGQLTLPKALRSKLHLSEGSRVLFEENQDGAVVIRSAALPADVEETARRVAEAAREVEPAARVIMFGSRARGDARPDSDWDFGFILPGEVTRERRYRIIDRMFELTLDDPTLIVNSFTCSESEWESPQRAIALFDNIRREGIEI